MTLSDNDKQEIIQYVNDNLDGESTCDDSGDDMVIFTFDRDQDEQPLVGTETILELLKQGFYVLFAGCRGNHGRIHVVGQIQRTVLFIQGSVCNGESDVPNVHAVQVNKSWRCGN